MNTSNQSNFPETPSFEEVSAKLETLFGRIREAIDEGALHVSEYANWQAEPIDFSLAPNLVRHKAKRYLLERGQDTKNEDDQDKSFKTEQVSNNGLYTTTPGFNVRILKSSDDGSVPPPGLSEARQNFYNQFQAIIDFVEWRNGNRSVQPDWNLIVHWMVDEQYRLVKLSVALPLRPSRSETGKIIPQCAFDEPIWIRPPQSNVAPIQGAPPPPPSSLEIPLEEEAEKSGEEPSKE